MKSLTDREKEVLITIIQLFVSSGHPVGSRVVAKHLDMSISPATIRNVMTDLEEYGIIKQPHTSAGRVPTDLGYRMYVNHFMQIEPLTTREKNLIREIVQSIDSNVEAILEKTSYILTKLTKQLGIVLAPRLQNGVLEKVDLVSVSSDKILIVLSIQYGFVKTLLIEIDFTIPLFQLEETTRVLNERLQGLTLREIQNTISERMIDRNSGHDEFIRVFIHTVENSLNIEREEELHLCWDSEIVRQPEFSNTENLQAIIEYVENKKAIIQFLNEHCTEPGIQITIGEENSYSKAKIFSVIATDYSFGDVQGKLGVVGPTRMRYSKLVPIVNYTAEQINDLLN